MDTSSPFEGDVPNDGDGERTYEWLDEWLCEYVDGTMDPSLEAVFEKYVEANPELKAHVERLKQTRELLCNCGLPTEPSEEREAEICRDVECDAPPPPGTEAEPDRTGPGPPLTTLGLVSSVTAALVVGFLVGAMVVGPVPSTLSSTTPPSEQRAAEAEPEPPSVERTQATAPEHPRPRTRLPLTPSDSGRAPTPLTTIGTR